MLIKRELTALVLCAGILILFSCTTASTAMQNNSNNPNYINIANFAFSPSGVTVASNTTIYWTNNDMVIHTVTSTGGQSYNSGNLSSGQGFSVLFTAVGTNAYYCSIHPYMTGKVIVTN